MGATPPRALTTMGVMVLPLLLALVAASPAPPAAASPGGVPGAVVEEIVAVLRNPVGAPPRVITLTRLTEEARIVLVSRGAMEAAFRPIDARALRATLEWVVDQTLLADEAARLQVAEVTRDQADAALARFRARFPDAATYRSFLASAQLGEEEISAALGRMLRVERYLETRVGRGGAVADADVLRWARERGLSVETAAAREAVRARMGEERVELAVRELVAELRGRADVHVVDAEVLGPAAGEGT